MTQSTLRSGHTPTPYPHLCKLTPKKLPRNLLPIFLNLASTRPVNSSILKILPRNLLPILLNIKKASDTMAANHELHLSHYRRKVS